MGDCSLTLSRIVLSRDVYYRTIEEMGEPPFGIENGGAIILADEYLMLGDNSPRSKDSRFFGPVRSDAILGVARWTYWPPARWRELR